MASMTSEGHGPSGYWYRKAAEGDGTTAILNALRDYTTSEAAMRRRTRESMGMGANDLLALRFLFQDKRSGRVSRPRDLAHRLGITSASVTTLVDRLIASGHIQRQQDPNDRRSIILQPTPDADREVRHTLGGMHERMRAAAGGMTDADTAVVVGFLRRMTEAVDAVDAAPDSAAGAGHVGPAASDAAPGGAAPGDESPGGPGHTSTHP